MFPQTLRRTGHLATIASVGLFTAAIATSMAPTASAKRSPNSSIQCGFKGYPTAGAKGDTLTTRYTVHNCRTTTVKRAVLFTGNKRGACRTYKPDAVYTGYTTRGFVKLLKCG